MKIPTLLLIGSLAVNAAVIALYVTKPAANNALASADTSGSAALGTSGSSPAAGRVASSSVTSATAQNWAQLQSGDLTTLAARLRAAGFSPTMVRAIVAAQVNEQFSARRKELLEQQEEQPFWKTGGSFYTDPKTQSALRASGREQMALMKSLLGPESAFDSEAILWQRRQSGNLPAEKISRIQAINADYNDLQQDIYTKTNGLFLPEDHEKLAFLAKEKLADLAKALSPQEFEDYQLRSSSTASQLRNQLGSFNPSEAEFRALFKAAAAVEAQYGSTMMSGSRGPDDIKNRQTAMLTQATAALSPERLAAYKSATDPQTQQVNRLVARLELPPATTQQVVALQTDIQTRARAVQSNTALPPADRATQLAALQQEATTKLTTALTPRGLEAYKQNGGFWLDQLKPRPAATPPSGTAPISTPGVFFLRGN